jgi:hypothetical protein
LAVQTATPASSKHASVCADQVGKFEDAIARHVKKARDCPRRENQTRRRLQALQQIFMGVNSWEGETVKGALESDLAIQESE